MIAPVPLRGMNRSLYINSTTGMRKANVFPEPVFADASKSLEKSSDRREHAGRSSPSFEKRSDGLRLDLGHGGQLHLVDRFQS